MLKTYSRKRRQESKIIENVHELCRLCLARAEEAVPIFGDVESVCAALPMRIMICVGHEITQEDCLPNKICTNCHQELERYYKFRKKCENSYLRLKNHFNATKYQDRISELQAENEIYNEDNKTSIGELLEYKMQDVELQPDEMERLVIVDVYNIEEHCDYDKPVLPVSSVAETKVKVEDKREETTEIQVIQQEEDVSPDIPTFLNAILVELGILVKNERGLVVQDQGVTSFELETGDDQHLEFELIEEDDEAESPAQVPETLIVSDEQSKPLTMDDSELKENKNVRVRKNIDSKKTAGAWCAACGRTFSSRGAARRHARAHAGRAHACPHCGRRFAQKAVMERHALVHQARRPHACPRCDKSFTQRGALAAHARSHAAPAPAALALRACAHCPRVFLYASGLSRHMLTHTGPGFSCDTCKRRFNDKSSLLRHARSAHPKSVQPISYPE